MPQGSRRTVCSEHTVLEEHPTLQLLKRPRKTHALEKMFHPWLFGVMVWKRKFKEAQTAVHVSVPSTQKKQVQASPVTEGRVPSNN